METCMIENDIRVFYITAASFPDGIGEAHQRLHALVPFTEGRRYFGISRPENEDGIVYRAAAEELRKGEARQYRCGTLIIKKGKYVCKILYNYTADLSMIARTFDELLTHPNLDPNGYCVEWYLSPTDMKCMIRLKE